MEKSKETSTGSDEGEFGDNSTKGDNHVEPIPKSSSDSVAFLEESLEGMEQPIGSNTLTVSNESLKSSEHILIHVEAPNDLHTGRSDRSGTENEDCSNCSQMKNEIRKLTKLRHFKPSWMITGKTGREQREGLAKAFITL